MSEKRRSQQEETDWFKTDNMPETQTSLAAKYQVSLPTFQKWIRPLKDKIDLKHKRTFTPAEVREIISLLGEYGS